jgi:PhzF family phenazine biosynthesis protein
MTLEILQVDSFTDQAFRGNPAGVCVLEQSADAGWMQAVATEMNLSETAFLVRRGEAYELRWFTPAAEVDLCGHATLASAHVLWEQGRLGPDETAMFDTASGRLTCTKQGPKIEMDFPACRAEPCPALPGLEEAVGVSFGFVGTSQVGHLVEIASSTELRGLSPDFKAVARLAPRGLLATSLDDDGEFDFLSRYFAPSFGIDEDPVTGSAHCCSGPFWAERLGRDELRACQVSQRTGIVDVRVAGDRVLLGGRAVTVLRAVMTGAASGSFVDAT